MKTTLAVLCTLFSLAAFAAPDCPRGTTNASYTGPAIGPEDVIPAEAVIRDVYCADAFRRTKYPNGFVTVYGGSRLAEDPSKPYDQKSADARLYDDIMTFAKAWTVRAGSRYPIMTGAGTGVMEAASRGAMDAGGPSIGYTTYYVGNKDPKAAFAVYPQKTGKPIITDGLIFSSVAVRENAMMNASAVVILAPGGTGTEWEVFQILEMMKSAQLTKAPVFLIGNRARYWEAFYQRIHDLRDRGMLGTFNLESLFELVEDVSQLVDKVDKALAH